MNNDIRDLLSRMADELDRYRQLLSDDRREVHALATEARAALAAEPVGEPSDKDSERLQWYTYDPEEGVELYSSREQAQSAAESIMGSYQVNAYSEGWHEDMELASWGALAPVEQAQIVARGPTELGDECDEWVRYELRAARWGTPATPPAPEPGEVGELVAELELMASHAAAACQFGDAKHLSDAATLLQQQAAPAPAVVPVVVSDALIKAECALSDIAEGEPECDEGDPAQWAEQRCAETLAVIRPVMKLHQIRTSEWPPQPLPQVGEAPSA